MATKHTGNLSSRDARRRLKARGTPYYASVGKRVHLGYRRIANSAGTWVARFYVDGKYQAEGIGAADDLADADGVAILSFWQASEIALDRAAEHQRKPRKKRSFKVKDAVEVYLDYLTREKRTAYDVGRRMAAHVLPALGDVEVAELSAPTIRKWHRDLADQAPRLRTRPGQEQKHRELEQDEESIRRRRVSSNRCLQQLKAALNKAVELELVHCDDTWRKVKIFRDVERARTRFLSVAECQRLLNAAAPDFRLMIRAGLETAARYGEITKLLVSNYLPDQGKVGFRITKAGKPRYVTLTADGDSFFADVCRGRVGDERIFRRDDGTPWLKSHQIRRMNEACRKAKISPAIGFHQLRHTWASLSIKAGLPLIMIATNLGHTDLRMVTSHYGHLEADHVAKEIRSRAPRFGKVVSNARAIR